MKSKQKNSVQGQGTDIRKAGWQDEPSKATGAGQVSLLDKRRYRNLLFRMVLSISLVTVIPLLIMTGTNYHQYQEAFHTEMIRPIARLTTTSKNSLEFFLSGRISALSMAIRERTQEDLADEKALDRLLANLKRSFGGFIDLGFVDNNGKQVSYSGPYNLKGKNYSDQDWFHEALLRGVYISDVFMGYRKFPHFVIAVRSEDSSNKSFILRATFDTEMINRQILNVNAARTSDAFVINRNGVLQTPSRYYGGVLQKTALPVPHFSSRAEVIETEDEKGDAVIMGYAYIERSPFILIELNRPSVMQEGWLSLRRELVAFLVISIILILAVVVWGSIYVVNRIREGDIRRANIFHKMEYANKLAAIGRLGAGVAHEINNPLAIINEKAGLLKDILSMSEEYPPKEKIISLVDSVLQSVNRCGKITKRLLGFAKHMDVQHEKIDIGVLLKEVYGFLEKEASYRDLKVNFDIPGDFPNIESDRSQLQQVFLNILNNAFAAVEDRGKIDIILERRGQTKIAVKVTDDGTGIPEEQLDKIFEPFYTTKKGSGTGLGLSITYGIVEKLGGTIKVKSKVGQGTTFTTILPIG